MKYRSDIAKAAKKFFRRNVTITERSFQAIESLKTEKSSPLLINLWMSLSRSLPSIHHFYSALDIDVEELTSLFQTYYNFPTKSNTSGEIDYKFWRNIFKQIFCEQDNRFRKGAWLTEAGENVYQNGVIEPKDLAAGILRARWFSEFYGKKVANPALRHLASASGLGKNVGWENEIASYSQKAFAAFDKISKTDSSYGSQQFILYSDGEKYRIAPFGVFGAYQLSENPLPDGSLWVARGNVIQPQEHFSEYKIAKLEYLINTEANEQEFQLFFEEHSEFLLALGDYVSMHPQIVIHEDSGKKLIPDFFLEKLNSDFCDICDLKKPSIDLVRRQQNRMRFRDVVMEAVAQLNYYRDCFEDKKNRNTFYSRYGLNAYRPRAVIIIGRSNSFHNEIERIKLQSQLPSWVELNTYDDVIQKARRWRNLVLN